ncbi:GNAT family N-acetyltransferase, partial [Desulfosporosinus nitroreducens]|uniref:GNAT family N-acetyltransferase n=1 Tax=Desulfosporosinus nitroreducens TaxID=2018668 RepID=UPI00207D1B41
LLYLNKHRHPTRSFGSFACAFIVPMLAVTLEFNQKLVGMVGIGNKSEVNNEIEIAYFVSEKYSHNGYIGEAVKAMTEWAFNKLKLDY